MDAQERQAGRAPSHCECGVNWLEAWLDGSGGGKTFCFLFWQARHATARMPFGRLRFWPLAGAAGGSRVGGAVECGSSWRAIAEREHVGGHIETCNHQRGSAAVVARLLETEQHGGGAKTV